MAALYANEKSLEGDLAFYGGEVKALGGGKIGGYAVLFTKEPDLEGDVFTKSTDFFIRDGDERPILYRHGKHPVIKARPLGRGKLTIDEIGVFLEGELELRDNYEKAIYKLAELGKLGWSTGSMAHLVSKTPKNKAFEVETWPIGELSLCPNPVEARTFAFPLKSMSDEVIDLDDFVKSLEEDQELKSVSLAGTPAILQFCEDVAPQSLKDGKERSESAATAAKEFLAIASVLGEAYHSYTARLVRRTENRFLKESKARPPDASTLAQVAQVIGDIEKVGPALESVKDSLLGIRKLSEMSRAEQRALDERARLAMWNFCRISGVTPEELEKDV